jgi:hypothetical protein
MQRPTYVVDTADDLPDLEARLNHLAEQRFEPLMVLPVPGAGESPVWFIIIAIQHPPIVQRPSWERAYDSKVNGHKAENEWERP